MTFEDSRTIRASKRILFKLGGYYEGTLNLLTLLLSYVLISAYLSNPKFNLNFMFGLNFGIIYIF
jgi:hypothetical protein